MTQPQPARSRRKALGCLIVLAFFFGLGLLRQIPDLLDPEAAQERRRIERERRIDEETDRILRLEAELQAELESQIDVQGMVQLERSATRLHWENTSAVTLTGAVWRAYESVDTYKQAGTDELTGGPFAPHRLRSPIAIPPGKGELLLSLLVKGDQRFVATVDRLGVVTLRCDQGRAVWAFD